MDFENNAIIVSIDKYSWNILQKQGFYVFPKGTREVKKYFVFYFGKPISAITHYAKVQLVEEGGKNEVGIGYWLQELPDVKPPFQIVKFEKIIKLKTPIKK